MKKNVYLARHGQTAGNVEKYAQGPLEPLNAAGLNEVKILASRCAGLPIDRLISSDMLRANQTAELIATACGLQVEETSLLREVSVSDVMTGVEGTDNAELLKKELFENIDNEAWFAKHNLESYRAVQSRAQATLQFLENTDATSIIVVTHGTFLKFLFGELLLGSTATAEQLHYFRVKIRLANAGLSKIVFSEHEWKIEMINNLSHFAKPV